MRKDPISDYSPEDQKIADDLDRWVLEATAGLSGPERLAYIAGWEMGLKYVELIGFEVDGWLSWFRMRKLLETTSKGGKP